MSQINLPVIHCKVIPRSIYGIIGPALNQCAVFPAFVQICLIHKKILHAVCFPIPDWAGGIHTHGLKFRHPAVDLLINRILSRRTFTHYIKYLSHHALRYFFHSVSPSVLSLNKPGTGRPAPGPEVPSSCIPLSHPGSAC